MKRGLLLLLFLLVLIPQPVFADSALDSILPKNSPANDPDNELYEQFDIDAYRFDGYYEGLSGPIFEVLNLFIGWAMVIAAMVCKMVIYLYQLAFTFPGFKDLARVISDLVNYLGGNFFKAVMQVGFTVMGVFVLYELVRRRYADSMMEIGKTLVFLALASLLFNNMYLVFTKIDSFSSSTSDLIITGLEDEKDKKGKPGTQAMVATGNQIWTNFIIIPWQLGEFGKTMKPGSKISPKSKDPIARQTYKMLKASAKKRGEYAEASVKGKKSNLFKESLKALGRSLGMKIKKNQPIYPIMTEGGIISRGTIVFFAVLGIIAFSPLLLIMSLFVAGYKIGFLLLGGLAAFIFLYALLPKGGIWTVVNWFKQWIGAGLYQIIAVFLLTFYLALSTELYKVFHDHGWGWFLSGVVLQVGVLVVLILQRKRVFRLFRRPISQIKNFSRHLSQSPKHVQNKTEQLAKEWPKKGLRAGWEGAKWVMAPTQQAGKAAKGYIQKFLNRTSDPKRPPRYVEPIRNQAAGPQPSEGLYRRKPSGEKTGLVWALSSGKPSLPGGSGSRSPVKSNRNTLPVVIPTNLKPTSGSIQNGRILNGQRYQERKPLLNEKTKATAMAAGKVALRLGMKAVTKI